MTVYSLDVLPIWNYIVPCPVLTCFLTCIQISQEAGQVVWYSHLLKNFPQFIVIHTVKGFSIVNKAEIDVLLEFSCFFCDLKDVGNLISGSSAFSKSSLNIWKFTVTYYWNLSWRILSIILLACGVIANPLCNTAERNNKINESWSSL